VQLHAIAHGNHHFAFVEERAKVGALTLWSGSETGHEQKTCQSEEKREAAYFTDGTHLDSPEVKHMIGIFRAKPRISQQTQPALSAGGLTRE
jgi:hypothetical protein